MKTSLRWAMVVSMTAAANLAAAEVPFTDGDMNVPSGDTEAAPQHLGTVPDEELGGGGGEPEGYRVELRPADEIVPRDLPAPELWTDRG